VMKDFVSSDGCSETEGWVCKPSVHHYLLEHPFFFG
jgi:hypothetical protein